MQDYGVVPELTSVLIMGAPDWKLCSELALDLVHSLGPCEAPPCSSDMPQLPKVKGWP